MASATKHKARDTRIDLLDVSWSGFKRMLKVRGERRSPRIWYLDGSLTLVSPSMPHELFAERFGTFVQEVTLGLDRPCIPLGSVTLARSGMGAAVEPDKSFYLDHAEDLRGTTELDLEVNPPPDLIIEVVVTHGAKQAMTIYRRLGVPEVWVCTRKRLRIFLRGADGRYEESETSGAFPSLKASEIFSWIDQPPLMLMNDWQSRLRAWVRDELAPRVRGEERRDGE
ncbi:Uma2 family endonuclease [Tautonia marina]|uniref:Uma2 family endonuclease n=1 Tax=Tautonia marina TaxID=2653855 RepID=UPI001260BF32|nr:Uma2 family endonuclease [Tautonia marina]